MSRAVSNAFIAAVNSPNTDEGFLVCVTIDHGSLSAPIYLVNNSQNVIRTVTSTAVEVLSAKAGNDATSTWTTGITNPSYPMSVRVVFAASWDGGDISLIGTDIFDAAQTETITAVANSTVQGLKVWKTITSISKGVVGSNAATFTTQTGSRVVFLACPFEPTLSDDSDDRPPVAKLVMDNIDRTMVAAVRSITTPPTVTLELIKISDPNTVEASFTDFQMKEVTYNNLTIEGTLTLEGLFSEPVVGFSFNPTSFPGLF